MSAIGPVSPFQAATPQPVPPTAGAEAPASLLEGQPVNSLLAKYLTQPDADKKVAANVNSILNEISPRVIRDLGQFGVAVHLMDGCSGYNHESRQVDVNLDLARQGGENLRHGILHELCGHAWLNQRNLAHLSAEEARQAQQRESMLFVTQNKSNKREVRDAEPLYEAYRLRTFVGNAVRYALYDVVARAPDKFPEHMAYLEDVGRQRLEQLNQPAEASGEVLRQEGLRSLALFDHLHDPTVVRDRNNNVVITFKEDASFMDRFWKNVGRDEFLKSQGLPTQPSRWSRMLDAGRDMLCRMSVSGPLAPLAGLLSRAVAPHATMQVDVGAKTPATIERYGNYYKVTSPPKSTIVYPWSAYAFKTQNVEEYLAEGITAMHESPQANQQLKDSDPALHGYLSTEIGYLFSK